MFGFRRMAKNNDARIEERTIYLTVDLGGKWVDHRVTITLGDEYGWSLASRVEGICRLMAERGFVSGTTYYAPHTIVSITAAEFVHRQDVE